MSINSYRKLSLEKIDEKVDDFKSELNLLVLDVRTGKEKDFSEIKKKKKEIARLLTVKNEKIILKIVDKPEIKKIKNKSVGKKIINSKEKQVNEKDKKTSKK